MPATCVVSLLQPDIERAADHLLGLFPVADEHQVDAEIVVRNDGIQGVLGLIKEFDRAFETGVLPSWGRRRNQYAPDISV